MKRTGESIGLLRLRSTISILGLILLFFGMVLTVRAAVTLQYFLADGQDGRVVLEWKTATEIDNAGFYVNRSLQETSGFARISAFIPAEGDDLTGATYTYTDTNVTNGTTYWYMLESIDFGQSSQFYEPPASTIPGEEDAPTATVTATRTGTLDAGTSTATRTATAPASQTLQPTNTSVGAYPGPATSTTIPGPATQTPVNPIAGTASAAVTPAGQAVPATPALSPTATPTFLPVPEIVMQFPAAPDQSTIREAPAVLNSPQIAADPQDPWRSPGRFLFIGFIVLIWVILGGWFYFSMRKIE